MFYNKGLVLKLSVREQGVYGKSLCLSLNLAMNLKLLKKKGVLKKNPYLYDCIFYAG